MKPSSIDSGQFFRLSPAKRRRNARKAEHLLGRLKSRAQLVAEGRTSPNLLAQRDRFETELRRIIAEWPG